MIFCAPANKQVESPGGPVSLWQSMAKRTGSRSLTDRVCRLHPSATRRVSASDRAVGRRRMTTTCAS